MINSLDQFVQGADVCRLKLELNLRATEHMSDDVDRDSGSPIDVLSEVGMEYFGDRPMSERNAFVVD